jgi:hypothetical protein
MVVEAAVKMMVLAVRAAKMMVLEVAAGKMTVLRVGAAERALSPCCSRRWHVTQSWSQ